VSVVLRRESHRKITIGRVVEFQVSIQEEEFSLGYIKNTFPNLIRKPRQADPMRLASSSIHRHPFTLIVSSRTLRPDQEAGPLEADIVIRDHHRRSAAAATQHRFHLCWRTHHSMKAAGCYCCCSRAAQCVVGALGTVVAADCSSVGSCMSLGRGLEACDRGPSLCRGRERSRAFCDGERLRILRVVSGLSMFES
jgi:hypothetical protein